MDKMIMNRLRSDYDYCLSEGYTVVGVFLFGSQNYNMQTPESDIDVKAVVIPALDDFVWGKTDIKEEISRENGTLVIYDIATFHKNIKKQSMNFVEILFTKYKIMNPEYQDLYSLMFEKKESIATLNTFKCIHCTLSQTKENYNKLFSERPSNEDRVRRAGYDYKAFAEILRLQDFLNVRISGVPYGLCLIPIDVTYLRRIKAYEEVFTLEQVKELADRCMKSMSDRVNLFDSVNGESVDEAMVDLVDEVTRNVILRYIKKEVHKNDRADSL